MRTLPIVALDEGREGGRSLGLAAPGPGVLPLLRDGAVHPLHLAALPRAVGPRVYVPCAGGLQQRVELAAAVARAVAGHHPLDGRAQPGEEAQRAAHERRAGGPALVGQQLRVGDAAEVVDGDVQAGAAGAAGRVAAAPQRAVAAPSGMRATFLTSAWTSSPDSRARSARVWWDRAAGPHR